MGRVDEEAKRMPSVVHPVALNIEGRNSSFGTMSIIVQEEKEASFLFEEVLFKESKGRKA